MNVRKLRRHRRVDRSGTKVARLDLLCVVATGLCAVAGAASAQSSASASINTTVEPYCAALTPGSPTSMALDSLVGPTGQLSPTFSGTTSYSLTGYYCNAPADITLTASPLRPSMAVTVSDVGSFTDRVDYTAALAWDDVNLQVLSADGAPAQTTTTEANLGVLTVTVSDPVTENNKRPVAATYDATVTLTIAPLA